LGQILVDEGILSAQGLEELLAMQVSRRQESHPLPAVESRDPEHLLHAAAAAGAEELIFTEGGAAMVRIGGRLQALGAPPLDAAPLTQFMVAHFGPEAVQRVAQGECEQRDFAQPGLGRGRMTAFRHNHGVGLVIRLHPEGTRALSDELRQSRLVECLDGTQGMVLVVGEHGSGVTETMGALLEHVAALPDRLILVLDERLEYAAPAGPAVVVRRRVGQHVRSYQDGLRGAIGQDADVLVIGDVSEPDVFDLGLRVAESGRLVIAGMPARSVLDAFQRMVALYPAAEAMRIRGTLSAVLRCVLAVQLVPSSDRRGRVLASELLVVEDAAREIISEGTLSQIDLLIRLSSARAGHSMDSSLLGLLQAGKILFHDALSRAEDKRALLGTKREG
jgi:twitching motility protein PilT